MNLTSILIISVVSFLIVTLLLVAMLLYAKAKLTPSGEVKLSINEGEKELIVSPGSTILTTLSNEKIFLPSACGGGGTCGMCKCRVTKGGGEILPTEVGFFTRKQQQTQWRLGCQVKVKEDMEIEIPEEVLGIKKWECEVVSNVNVATFI
ncbi:MAG: 2Fe-2S iron-sulfur cluster-binding protein, partial [Bacteroidales bacterium]|nr:2Fe-2S iron-sulfur cluster-binding protein [Bacteroidales bacterium]